MGTAISRSHPDRGRSSEPLTQAVGAYSVPGGSGWVKPAALSPDEEERGKQSWRDWAAERAQARAAVADRSGGGVG